MKILWIAAACLLITNCPSVKTTVELIPTNARHVLRKEQDYVLNKLHNSFMRKLQDRSCFHVCMQLEAEDTKSFTW